MKTAIYKMTNNKYLGDCIAIVIKLERDEKPESFTRDEVLVFIKTTQKMYEKINTVDELRRAQDLFGGIAPCLREGCECMLGVFGDSHCNCENERENAMSMIGEKLGVYIHTPQEAQGQGLFYKAQELHLQVNGVMPDGTYVGPKTQSEAANLLLGKSIIDIRNYTLTAQILQNLGLEKYQFAFMSRNHNKCKEMAKAGIQIASMVDIPSHMNIDNIGETLVKWVEKGFCFTEDEAQQIIALLAQHRELPERAVKLIEKAATMYQTEEGRKRLTKRSHLLPATQVLLEHVVCEFIPMAKDVA